MSKEFSPRRLDVKAFAQAGGQLSGRDSLLRYERLAQGASGLRPDLLVEWQATGDLRQQAQGGAAQVWLHINVRARFPMECQRCLNPVDVALQVERAFRFVADEATAQALDDASEEDLLALSREFDLYALLEDELLLCLPVVPRHEECPGAPAASAAAPGDPDDSPDEAAAHSASAKTNPFAALAGLRSAPASAGAGRAAGKPQKPGKPGKLERPEKPEKLEIQAPARRQRRGL